MVTVLEVCRVARGLSATGLSRKLGFSRSVVPQIENGLPAWPSLRVKLSDFLGVEADVLFESSGHARKIAAERIIEMINSREVS